MTDRFADRYDIQRELGRGAFGVVYLAHDTRLRNRPVALKILHPVLSTDPGVVRLFQNEAGVLATLQHDHIATVYDADVWQDRRYIVMAYVDGPSVALIVHEQGAQPLCGDANMDPDLAIQPGLSFAFVLQCVQGVQ